jgi:adenine phosphoribosyltransferase
MKNLEDYILNVQDFPKKGIVFKDITSLLANPKGVELCLETLLSSLEGHVIDKVVGIESRGFFFGMMLAQHLKVPFIPVRKPGKLPRKVRSQSYALEYGTDTLEIHDDAIQYGDRVLVHDDVLATGGTAQAVCSMVNAMGGTVVQCNFIMKLSFLEGEKKLTDYSVFSAVSY